MIVSRLNSDRDCWKDPSKFNSRLTGPSDLCIDISYQVFGMFHRLYSRSAYFDVPYWEINNKLLRNFKEI